MKQRGGWIRLLVIALTSCPATVVVAQSIFLPTGDARLREDIGILIDEGVIDMPQKTWPLPAADVRMAVSKVRPGDVGSLALLAALGRVTRKVEPEEVVDGWRLREARLTVGEPGLLRNYSTLGRDQLEASLLGGATTDRWSLNIAVTGVASPEDGRNVRLDGSEASIRWGNWLVSANQIDRWWGPGYGGGLILSTNARPMPGVSVDRIRSTSLDVPVLRWLGPWRFSALLGVMEDDRPDVQKPLFMGMRFSFKPVPIMEFGLSRTAQFCGRGRPCDLETFGRVLIGQDNAGIRGLDPDDEPGNQMAGFDARLVSPFRPLPVALYAELIGEDGSSTGIPERYLGLFGAEAWWLTDSGANWRLRIEHANTSCKWYSPATNSDCAYRQGIFRAGYRYRSRAIGHTTDSDSESTTLQLVWTRPDGSRWEGVWRTATLDRHGMPDAHNPLTFGRGGYESAELSWSGVLYLQEIGVQVGYERQTGGSRHHSGAFGFIQWRKNL